MMIYEQIDLFEVSFDPQKIDSVQLTGFVWPKDSAAEKAGKTKRCANIHE